MNHCKSADCYHMMGYNCTQSLLAAFSDLTGISEKDSLSIAGCFGRGAGSGEMCGAISGAIMVLGALTPINTDDPAGSKLRSVALGREFLKRFSEKFGSVRCETLINKPLEVNSSLPAAKALGITDHCSILAVTAAEIVEEMLSER